MAKQSKNAGGQYVRKETFWLVTLPLAVGFFGGVMFGVFKTDTAEMPGLPAPSTSTATDAGNATDSGKASMIAALEKETRSNPGNLEAWIELGNGYFDTNQYEKSIGAYTKALKSVRIMPMSGPIWASCIVRLGIRRKR